MSERKTRREIKAERDLAQFEAEALRSDLTLYRANPLLLVEELIERRDDEINAGSEALAGAHAYSRGLEAEVARLTKERDTFREHSIMLNSTAWALSVSLGLVDPSEDEHEIEATPPEMVARLTKERDDARFEHVPLEPMYVLDAADRQSLRHAADILEATDLVLDASRVRDIAHRKVS